MKRRHSRHNERKTGMNKNTKFEIGGRSEFLAVIDEIGDLQVAIEGM